MATMRRLALSTAVFLLMIAAASAVELLPEKTELVYEAGSLATVTFLATNTGDGSETFDLYIVGPSFEDYVGFEKQQITVSPNQKSAFTATLLMPQKLSSGVSTFRVGIKSQSTGEFAESIIDILVPHSGTFLKTTVSVSDTQVKQPAEIAIKVENLGPKDAELVKPKVEIYNSDGELIVSLDTEAKTIEAKDDKIFRVYWSGSKSGKHKARATVELNGQTSASEGYFTLTRSSIYFTGITASDTALGSPANFDVEVKNEGASEVSGTIKTVLLKGDSTVDSLPDKEVLVNAKETKTVALTWEGAAGQKAGDYKVFVRLNYGAYSTTFSKSFKIVDTSNPFISGSSPMIAVVVALMFALIVQYTGFGSKRK